MSVNILVVDDSASDRLIIQRILNDFNVLVACDGLEAMCMLEEHDINLVILDLNMPRMDGFQVLKALQSNDRYKNVRTIILTNYDELENEIKGLEMGAVDYIRKPIQMYSLKARIDVHVELIRIQQALEQKLNEQGLTFDVVFNQAPIGIIISPGGEPLDTNNTLFTRINPMFEQIIGRTEAEFNKVGCEQITHPDDFEVYKRNIQELHSGRIKSFSMKKRLIRRDGSVVWVHMVVAALKIPGDGKFNHICLVQDFTKQKEAERALLESERSKSVLISRLPGLAYRRTHGSEFMMEFVSDGSYELTGYPSDKLLYSRGISFGDVIAPEYRESLWKEQERCIAGRLPFNVEYEIITADGRRKWVLDLGQGVYDAQGEVEAVEGIILDISDRKEMENHLRYNNEHDRWTGLYNRGYLENLLKKDAEKGLTEKRAVVSINLSPVKLLTVTYGFHYSQEVVKRVADALKQHCTEKCLLFNTFENRFVFYLKGYRDKKELTEFCEDVADTLESLLTGERVGGGIGVLEINEDNQQDVDQLLKKLLIASEKATDINSTNFDICFYDAKMEAEIRREEDIKQELAQIVEEANHGGLFLQYQPILDLKSNQVCGFEALARIKSSKYGLIPPLEFIPISEKTNLIIPLGRKVMLQAFRFLKKLGDNGYGTLKVSINVSVIQLLKDDFCRHLFEMIEQTKVSPENISLEITESVFSSNYQEINRILGELKDAGFHIAIDDFGTGYSSLAREQELNVNCLKIAKHFIDKLMFVKPENAIVRYIISMAHMFGHYVIAEGVEHEEQKQLLVKWGCDKIQGYLVSKPLDEEAALAFLQGKQHQ